MGHILSDSGIEVDPEKIEVIKSFRVPKNNEESPRIMKKPAVFPGSLHMLENLFLNWPRTRNPYANYYENTTNFNGAILRKRLFKS